MNTQQVFCPNLDCPARERQNEGDMGIPNAKEGWYTAANADGHSVTGATHCFVVYVAMRQRLFG